MENVEEALRVLYTTTNPSLRRSADKWLQDFQASDAAWELATGLISSGRSAESRLFGCTVLCNRLRGGNLGGLPPESAKSLRTALLQQLARLSGERALVANVEPQLCHAIASLLVGGVTALLGDPAFGALPAPSMLRVLALVPESGAFLETEEIEAMQVLLLAWLDAAYSCADEAPCPYPPQVAATAPPALGGRAHRIAVLECAGQWAALPASEHGLTLRRLAEARCFAPLLRALDLRAVPLATDAAPFFREARLSFELCRAALDLEDAEPEFVDTAALPAAAAAASDFCAAPGRACGAGGAKQRQMVGAKQRQMVGTLLPAVPVTALRELLAATARAIEPLASTAVGAGGEPEEEDEEEDDEASGAQLAAVGLGGAMLRQASALLAPPGVDASGNPAAVDAARSALRAAMVALLHRVVPCATHRRRPLCEVALGTDFWPAVLRAVATWDAPPRDALVEGASAALAARVSFPSEETLASWDEAGLEEYCGFREAFLGVAVTELARQRPLAFAAHAVHVLVLGTPGGLPDSCGAAGGGSWQQREAALFAATASVEGLLSRVLAPPGMPPPAAAVETGAMLVSLLRAALAPPPADASRAGCALLLRARCKLVTALAPFLAVAPVELEEALRGVLPCLPNAAATTAAAALESLVLLSRRCASEIASSQELIEALLDALGRGLADPDAERRAALISACARVVACSETHAERFVAPFVSELQRAGATLHDAADEPGPADDLVMNQSRARVAAQLAERLGDATAALAPLRPLPKPKLVAVLTHLWPAWCAIAPAAVRAGVEAQVLPALCQLAQEAVRAVRARFAPLLPQTAAVLTAAFNASPSAPLLELASGLLEAFAGALSAEQAAAFGALLDTLAERTLRALAAAPLEQPALLAALLSHADLHAKLLVPSLATAASLPALLGLAASLLGSCREPEPLDAAMCLLSAAAAAARATSAQQWQPGYTITEAEAAAHRARLQAALGAAGEAIVRGSIVGLVDSLPEPSWPCIADMLAPMLHLEPWARPDGLRVWAHAAIAALPTTGGAPDARCREVLLALLCAFPDPCTAGASYHRLVGQLGAALADFARVARRLQPAHTFDLARYDWAAAAAQPRGVQPGVGPNLDRVL